MNKFYQGQKVTIAGDLGIGVFGRPTLDPIPDGEDCRVLEDYGQTHVNVMRSNGQLRTILRACISVAS